MNFSLALMALVVASLVLLHKALRQAGSQFFDSLMAWRQKRAKSLGSEMVGKLSYYERWIVAFANILFQKQVLTREELARKMNEVAEQYAEAVDSCRKTAAG